MDDVIEEAEAEATGTDYGEFDDRERICGNRRRCIRRKRACKCLIATIMTIGVYGLVAAIVKLDDLGLWLIGRTGASARRRLQRRCGNIILRAAPLLMKFLAFAGTCAMLGLWCAILPVIAPVHMTEP